MVCVNLTISKVRMILICSMSDVILVVPNHDPALLFHCFHPKHWGLMCVVWHWLRDNLSLTSMFISFGMDLLACPTTLKLTGSKFLQFLSN